MEEGLWNQELQVSILSYVKMLIIEMKAAMMLTIMKNVTKIVIG